MTCEETTTCGCDDRSSNSHQEVCQCDDDLPAKPYTALRVAYGMLLGEDDFRVLMANPRGKHMLTSAWLHGAGVVWGFEVCWEGTRQLKISPGLAVDGLGRLCAQEASQCLDLSAWVDKTAESSDRDCAVQTIHACLSVEFDSCRTRPVPTLADPCDVTRKHDDLSRVIETSKLALVRGECACPQAPYHRTRVLLGIDEPGPQDCPGDEALAARRCVAEMPPADRPAALLAEFRRMSALDSACLRPPSQTGCESLFPVLTASAPVVLACLEIKVKHQDNCTEVECVGISTCCRRALLPTATIQELLCGLAPGLIEPDHADDAGGPRICRESVRWGNGGSTVSFSVTAPLNKSTVRGAVRITSLRNRGWVEEDVIGVRCHDDDTRVEVELADPPAYEIVRLIVKGTGPVPAFGADPPLPLAGFEDDPPCSADDGRDAVMTFTNGLPGVEKVAQ